MNNLYETMEALLCEMQGLRDELADVERERDEAREALRDCVWWAESVSRRVTEDRDGINWTGLELARKALADIQKEAK